MSDERFKLSELGRRFTRPTGALELMDDLGRAIGAGDEILLLGGGNPAKIPEIQALVRERLREVADDPKALERMISNYAHPTGDLPFRRALAKLLAAEYGWPLTAEHIALTAGSQASFFLLFNLLAGRSADGRMRRVLLPTTPEYVGYADVGVEDGLIAARCPVIEETSDRSFKYRVDFDNLALDDEIGAICVSRPANPTGNVLTDSELARLASLAKAARVPLIIDGAYGLPFPGIVFGDATPLWNEDVVLCLSLSKLGLPGVRTGIVVAHPELIDALTRMTAVLNLAVGSVGPVLAEPWVESGEILALGRRTIMPFYRDKACRAREILERELEGVPFRIHELEGAFFMWLWLPGLPIASAELYRRLKERGVLVLSGHYFFPGLDEPWPHKHECVRISYAQDDETVARGLALLAREVRAAFDGPPVHSVRASGGERSPNAKSPSAPERQAATAVLMIRPAHFGANAETAASNRFQSPDGNATDAASIAYAAPAEFDALADALERAGVRVHVLEGRETPVCPDEVFPNNWFSTHADGTLVLYPMMAPNRRLERRSDLRHELERHGYAVRQVLDLSGLEARGLFLEGTGSLVLDRANRLAFACVSARTSPEAVHELCARLGYEPIVFGACDRDGHPIYHTNVMMSVGTEFAVVASETIRERRDRERVLGALRETGKRLIAIGHDELRAFAGNLLELSGGRGPVIALSRRALDALAPAARAALAEHGELVTASIDTIETLGGGSVRCMLAEVHLPRAEPTPAA